MWGRSGDRCPARCSWPSWWSCAWGQRTEWWWSCLWCSWWECLPNWPRWFPALPSGSGFASVFPPPQPARESKNQYRVTAALYLPPTLWDNVAENKAAQGRLNSHCLPCLYSQVSVLWCHLFCMTFPVIFHLPFFFTHLWFLSWNSPLSSSPSLLLKACSWALQSDCYNLGVKQKSSLKMYTGFMKKVGKRYIVGATWPFLLSNEYKSNYK